MTGLLDLRVNRDGRTLTAWKVGGEAVRFASPFPPYFWTSTEKQGVPNEQRIYLSDLHLTPFTQVKTHGVWKQIADNVYDIRRLRDLVVGFEDDVRFVERICIDRGFRQNLRLSDLKMLAFDVECHGKGQFPNPRRPSDRLTAIALWSRNRQAVYTDEDEASIIEKAAKLIRDYDPDVLFDYSGTAIEYEYPLIRSRLLGCKWHLGRTPHNEPWVLRNVYHRKHFERVECTTYLDGRLCMDVFKEALFDTALTGVRKSLKTIGRLFFGDIVDVIEEDRTRLGSLTREELGRYCFSDARLCYLLGEHYMRMILVPLAMRSQLPLGMIVHRKPSHSGNVFYGRNYSNKGIISDGSNIERFERTVGTLRGVQKTRKKRQTTLGEQE